MLEHTPDMIAGMPVDIDGKENVLEWGPREDFVMPEHNLDTFVQRKFLSVAEERQLFDRLKKEIPWFRVKYLSSRHGNNCETPCWTNMFGGIQGIAPFQPIPPILQELIARVQTATPKTPYNAVLCRLYFDGTDQIAWHTDGRTFLGDSPTIASLSLGCRASFEMRKMTNVWPCSGTPNGGVDASVDPIKIAVNGGDLLVMKGRTQASWHHRVPLERGRGPRININFRYILPGRDETTVRGVQAFYKYMVSGDDKTADWQITAPSFGWDDIVKKRGPMHLFVSSASTAPSDKSSSSGRNAPREIAEGPVAEAACGAECVEEGDKGVWICSACTFVNRNTSALACDVCIEPRSKVQKTKGSSGVQSSSGSSNGNGNGKKGFVLAGNGSKTPITAFFSLQGKK